MCTCVHFHLLMYFVVEVTSDGSARQSGINLSEHGRQKRDEGTEEQSPLSRPRERCPFLPRRRQRPHSTPPPPLRVRSMLHLTIPTPKGAGTAPQERCPPH